MLHALLLVTVSPLLPIRFSAPAKRSLHAVLARPAAQGVDASANRAEAVPVDYLTIAGKATAGSAVMTRRPAALPRAEQGRGSGSRPLRASAAVAVSAAAPATAAPEQEQRHALQAAAGERVPAEAPALPAADDLRSYRLDLALAARRSKVYPLIALEQRKQGEVLVEVKLSAVMPRPQVNLARSSGSPELDREALKMIEYATTATALPNALRGLDFRILLPVGFVLDDPR